MGSLFNFSPCREVDWRTQATKAENGKGRGGGRKTTDPFEGDMDPVHC